MKTTKYGICPICGSSCGLIVEMENGAIQQITGDQQDPHSRGYTCPKGRSLKYQHVDPDRVLHPLKKENGDWREVSWDEALGDIASRIADMRKRYGPDSLAVYAGDGTTHSYETLFAIAAFVLGLGIKNMYTANSMDALPRLFASMLLYGNSGILPIPDVKRTDYFLILGSNPVVTNGSVMTAPGFARYIKDIQERGGKVVVVDPRRSETAAIADEHHFIRPESDVLFLLSLMNVIFEEKRDRPGKLNKWIRGYEALRKRALEYTPERVEASTGIPVDEIRGIAREFAAAPSAVCYGRMGTCAQSFGSTASAFIDILNIITGNMDRPGGAMFTTPVIDVVSLMSALGINGAFAKNRTRVSGMPDFNGEMPCAALAEEIEAPNGIRALIVAGGNPAVAVPDSARLTRAFSKLDLMVSLDPHINATSCHAHYILPPAIGLEHEIFPMMSYATAIHNAAKWAPPVLDPPPTVKYDAEILSELLCRILCHQNAIPQPVEKGLLKLGKNLKGIELIKALMELGPYGRLRSKPGGRERLTLSKLKASPHGIELGPLEPRLDKILGRKGRINLMPDILKNEFSRIAESADNFKYEHDDCDTLILTSRRQLRFFNTSLHNIEKLATGPDQCTLEINSEDASARGLSTGDTAIIETANGAEEYIVEVTDGIMPGVISIPFGWNGRQPAARQKILNANPGTNVNTITNPSRIDPVSAMTAFNGTRVRIRKS